MEKKESNEKAEVNFKKYISKESLEEFRRNVEKSMSFLPALLLPVIILNIFFLSISVYIKIRYNSNILYILFFAVSLVVSIIGGGVFGLRSAIKNTSAGIRGIVGYSYALFRDLYPVIKKEKDFKGFSPAETYRIITLGIVLPYVKHVLDRRLLGGVFYFFVEQIVTRSSGIIEGAIDKYTKSREEIDTGNEDVFSEQARQTEAGSAFEKVGSGFDTAIKGIILLLDIIWILATVLGLLALVVLVIVFNIL